MSVQPAPSSGVDEAAAPAPASAQDVAAYMEAERVRGLQPLAAAAAQAAAHNAGEHSYPAPDTNGRVPAVAPVFATFAYPGSSGPPADVDELLPVPVIAPPAPIVDEAPPAKRTRRSKAAYANESGSDGSGEAKPSTSAGGSGTGRVVKDTKRAEQNRIAQRNFRERKESKMRELEAKAAELAEFKTRVAVLEQRERDLVARETALANLGAAHASEVENIALRAQVAGLLKSLEEARNHRGDAS